MTLKLRQNTNNGFCLKIFLGNDIGVDPVTIFNANFANFTNMAKKIFA